MPNIKSAIKRVKVEERRAGRNRMIKSRLKTSLKKFDAAVAAGDSDLQTVYQKIRRVVHIKVRRIAYRINILVGNLADENILDVDFFLVNQEQQQIQRSVKILELKRHCHVLCPHDSPKTAKNPLRKNS